MPGKTHLALAQKKANQSGLRSAAGAPQAVCGVPLHPLLRLQQAAGNQAVLQMPRGRGLQARLEVGMPGDVYEQEADRVAEEVMRAPPGPSSECSGCRSKRLVRQHQPATAAMPFIAPPIVEEVLRAPGQPLDAATRAFLEPRFGHNFSQVLIHTDPRAAESARAVNARAFTVGRSIVFDTDRFSPGTAEGRRLLAHELTHAMQQWEPATPEGMYPTVRRQEQSEPEDARRQAHQAVDAFRKSSSRSVWPKLDRQQLAREIEERIDEPDIINQSVLNVCGPAAVVHLLALADPVQFVAMMKELFETGKTTVDGETLSAGADLRLNGPPVGMAQADWMLMSSIRDSENLVLDYEGTAGEDFSGITTPGEIVKWMKSMLKCKNATWKSAYLSGETQIMEEAGNAVAAGKTVVLLIDEAMLFGLPRMGKIGYPNHWVVLKSPVAFAHTTVNVEHEGKPVSQSEEETVQFDIWTWGEKDLRRVKLDKRTFEKTFYGAAICQP